MVYFPLRCISDIISWSFMLCQLKYYVILPSPTPRSSQWYEDENDGRNNHQQKNYFRGHPDLKGGDAFAVVNGLRRRDDVAYCGCDKEEPTSSCPKMLIRIQWLGYPQAFYLCVFWFSAASGFSMFDTT